MTGDQMLARLKCVSSPGGEPNLSPRSSQSTGILVTSCSSDISLGPRPSTIASTSSVIDAYLTVSISAYQWKARARAVTNGKTRDRPGAVCGCVLDRGYDRAIMYQRRSHLRVLAAISSPDRDDVIAPSFAREANGILPGSASACHPYRRSRSSSLETPEFTSGTPRTKTRVLPATGSSSEAGTPAQAIEPPQLSLVVPQRRLTAADLEARLTL